MMLCGKKFVLLGWNSCSPNRSNKPQYSLDGISFRAWLKNGTQTATARHKGKKNLFNCCWSGRIPFRAKMCYSPEYSSFIWESIGFMVFWILKVGNGESFRVR